MPFASLPLRRATQFHKLWFPASWQLASCHRVNPPQLDHQSAGSSRRKTAYGLWGKVTSVTIPSYKLRQRCPLSRASSNNQGISSSWLVASNVSLESFLF